MSISTFIDHAQSLLPPFFADLQQFEGTEAEMHFHDQSSISRTSEIAHERAKAFFLHLEKKLSTQGGNKSPLQILLERISKQPQTKENGPLIAAITQAFFKQRGYLSRLLFSNESWEEWTENRTALGKVAFLLRDCTESSRRVRHCIQRLDEGVIQQTNQEAETLLKCLDHRDTAKERSFHSEISCSTGLFGGIFGALLTQHPLPLFLGFSQCFPGVRAQQKVGSEFQINTYTANNQAWSSVASFPNSNFVVTWQSFDQDGSNNGIYGQLFNGTGFKIGSEFRVNNYTQDYQESPSVASLNNNNFIVTWFSASQDGSGNGIFAQIFNETGGKIRSEFQVNTFTDNHQSYPAVTGLRSGNFVVTWNSEQDGSVNGIYGQLFNGTSSKIGSEFRVNNYTQLSQYKPAVANFGNDNFVVTWESDGQDGNAWGIFGQLFDENGAKIGNEFQVNTYTNNSQLLSSVVSFNDNNFVVAWASLGQDGSDYGVYGQLFDENGTKIRNEFQVNTYITNVQWFPSVAGLSNGHFVVAWESVAQDGSIWGVFGQLFDEGGTKIGNEFQVNTYTNSSQLSSSVASLQGNNFVVIWQSNSQDGSGYGVYGQIFHGNLTLSSSTSTTSIFPPTTTAPSSNRNNRLLWLWLLLGGAGGMTCLGLTGCYLFKKRPWQREVQDDEHGLERIHYDNTDLPSRGSTNAEDEGVSPQRDSVDRGSGLSSKREGKKHTRIGDRYDLVNRISRTEAQTLYEQTGIIIEFPHGKNRTDAVIGEGSFGKVRLAYDIVTERFVGVKKIKGADQIAQSREEGVLQSKLKGKPNILPILDYVDAVDSNDNPVIYEFMSLAGFGNGEMLRDQLQALSDPARKEQILTHVAKGLLTGLFHMHEAHIYHLDIKPSNMVLDMQGEPFIIDFGCAKELPSGQIREEMTGDTEYYCPERIAFYRQMCNRQQPDPIAADKVDVWALGVSLLELATGAYPFDRTRFSEKIRQWDTAYFQAKLDAIPLLKNPAPGSFMSIVKGLLEIDPQKRLSIEDALAQFAHIAPFPSPSEQQAAFASLKQQTPSSTEPPSLPRDQDERYAAVFTRRYRLTPDFVHPEYELTPDFVQRPSSQASSAGQYRSYEEAMRAE